MKVYGVVIKNHVVIGMMARLAKRGEFQARDVEKDLRKYKLAEPIPLVSYSPPTIDDVYYRGADRILQYLKKRGLVRPVKPRTAQWIWIGYGDEV